jgi:uncharacterized repeat protein (TIGR03803 family)
MLDSKRKFRFKRFAAHFAIVAITSMVCAAQAVSTLVVFDGTNGANPFKVKLVQGRDGNLWGTTSKGGVFSCPSGCGTVFKLTPAGQLTVFSLTDASGSVPVAGLVLGTDGNFYGVASSGGRFSNGTVFKVESNGSFTVLYNFYKAHGTNPVGALVQGIDGNFCGTTEMGGTNNDGTIFRITPGGVLTSLYSFDPAQCGFPIGALVQGSDGNFYGTTEGPPSTYGCIFKISPTGSFTLLHRFNGVDGSGSQAGLVQLKSGGAFYGTTLDGGASKLGTIFKITPAGSFTTLASFSGRNGGEPAAPLIQATDGKLYGTTNYNTVFDVTPAGVLTSLSPVPGIDPVGGLVQHTNGKFYGASYKGGPPDDGLLFSFDIGLGPFVALVRYSGKVGSTAQILGGGLTGTTSVTFNGISAGFTVVSDTFLEAIVPSGATTGPIQVNTPGGALTSNKPFQVTP